MSEIKTIVCGNVNCFLIENEGKAILVDTGRTAYREKIEACIKKKNKIELQLIVLTHGHLDHIQNAAYLAKQFQVPIAMHERDKDLIQDNLAQSLSAKGIIGTIMLQVSLRSFYIEKIEPFIPDIYLKEGDNLWKYGIDAAILELEGHTKGSIGLDIEGKALIVGDALMNIVSPSVSRLYTDKKRMLESAEKISETGERIIYFGHGKPRKNRKYKIKIEDRKNDYNNSF